MKQENYMIQTALYDSLQNTGYTSYMHADVKHLLLYLSISKRALSLSLSLYIYIYMYIIKHKKPVPLLLIQKKKDNTKPLQKLLKHRRSPSLSSLSRKDNAKKLLKHKRSSPSLTPSLSLTHTHTKNQKLIEMKLELTILLLILEVNYISHNRNAKFIERKLRPCLVTVSPKQF